MISIGGSACSRIPVDGVRVIPIEKIVEKNFKKSELEITYQDYQRFEPEYIFPDTSDK